MNSPHLINKELDTAYRTDAPRPGSATIANAAVDPSKRYRLTKQARLPFAVQIFPRAWKKAEAGGAVRGGARGPDLAFSARVGHSEVSIGVRVRCAPSCFFGNGADPRRFLLVTVVNIDEGPSANISIHRCSLRVATGPVDCCVDVGNKHNGHQRRRGAPWSYRLVSVGVNWVSGPCGPIRAPRGHVKPFLPRNYLARNEIADRTYSIPPIQPEVRRRRSTRVKSRRRRRRPISNARAHPGKRRRVRDIIVPGDYAKIRVRCHL